MNRLLALFITFFLLNNCSFNENSRIWKDKEKDLSEKENVKKIFAEEEIKASEFNQEVKLNLSGLRTSNKIIDNINIINDSNSNTANCSNDCLRRPRCVSSR